MAGAPPGAPVGPPAGMQEPVLESREEVGGKLQDQNNNNTLDEGRRGGRDKCYSLRPRAAGVSVKGEEGDEEEEDGENFWKKGRRVKGRKRGKGSAPLSKYRRKTANARERSRMREINEAFDSLRRAVPGGGEPEKLTKITTLRLAMRYIAALREALADGTTSTTSNQIQSPPPSSTASSPFDPLDHRLSIDEEKDDEEDFFESLLTPLVDFDDFFLVT